MKVRFTGELELPEEGILRNAPESRTQLIRDCTISGLWSQLNDGGLTEPIIRRLNMKIELIPNSEV